jgi:hypothetical protein
MPSAWTEILDSSQTVSEDSTRESLFYVERFMVAFDDTTSGPAIRAILRTFNARVVGGVPDLPPRGAYVVRIIPPERTFAGVEEVAAKLNGAPGVSLAMHMAYRDRPGLR